MVNTDLQLKTKVEGDVASRKKSAAEIFLEEWSTMGKKRPTLEDLMNLLVEVKLIKVANYVAALLGCDPPKRPDCRAPFDVSEMLENQIEKQDNGIDNSQISPSITDAAPSTAACHSYDGCKDTKLKSFDNTVQPPQSSSSSLSTSSSGVNEPLQNDTRESSDSSLSLKATNAETTYIPKIENVISSEIPSFLNNNNPTTFESITSDESISINSNSSNSNSDIGLPVFLPHYEETKK
ncbi:uncharacterized protein LOC122849775 isoform X2 [Aphidius gifuensis]|uniref:uncharacterized protein LOC122849775 isoform X2 n=1 Tax=Aphidius gifuensis TaxID=684658 RepID=UPI001CDBC850|nr:uncharacterized protein LOC122849775 isoform X2 [Aphidius gifuensis]